MKKKLLVLAISSLFFSPVMAQPTVTTKAPQKELVKESLPKESQAKEVGVIRGLITAEKEAILSSPMSGRLKNFELKPGQRVGVGKVVLSFDCEEQEAKRDIAKAELESAMDSQQAKMKMQGLSQASELEVKIAASAVEKAQANNNMFNVYLKNCNLVAPFSGKISKINVKPYQGVQFGQPLVELISDTSLKIKANVPAKLITNVKVGNQLSIDVDETSKSYPATISAVNSKIDPVSQTFEIEAKIPKSEDLISGMSGNVNFK